MTSRTPYDGIVLRRQRLSAHLMRLVIGELDGWQTSGVPDEWVALTVPGQFQTRYYTVRSASEGEMVLDVVVHADGLVTEWATGDCVGGPVSVGEPKGSFDVPDDAGWVWCAGDLTGLPGMARILETTDLPARAWVETGDGPIEGYFAEEVADRVTWVKPPARGESALAKLVSGFDWPEGPGYFWMAGESAQMRDIRRHVRRDLGWDSKHQALMGYWSNTRGRVAAAQAALDPAPFVARGRALGKSDEQIWAEYDEARSS